MLPVVRRFQSAVKRVTGFNVTADATADRGETVPAPAIPTGVKGTVPTLL
jgi:hypothetical protein